MTACSASLGRAGVEDFGDVGMIHQGQGLTLGFEAGDDRFSVHAQLDQAGFGFTYRNGNSPWTGKDPGPVESLSYRPKPPQNDCQRELESSLKIGIAIAHDLR
jgi:hypothetical protein